MTWYNPRTWFADSTKLNPAQTVIERQEGTFIGTDFQITYAQAFDKLECVRSEEHTSELQSRF